MDTIVVGVLDPKPGTCTSRMVSVRPVPMSPPVASSACCSGVRSLAAVRPDEQPGGALAGGRALGVVGQRGDPVQRRVHPQPAGHHRDDETKISRRAGCGPNVVCAEAFSAFGGAGGGGDAAAVAARGGRCAAGGAAAAAVGTSGGSAASAASGGGGSSGPAGSPATAPGAARGSGPGLRPVVVHTRMYVLRYQPAQVARRQRVADKRDRVDDPVRDDQRPQPAGAPPHVAEHQAHHDIAQPRAEALIEVVERRAAGWAISRRPPG